MKARVVFLVFLIILSLLAYLPSLNAQIVYPNPSFVYSPLTPRAGDVVTFDSSWWEKYWIETYGYRNFSYSWYFGDNTSSTGVTVNHIFTNPGTYNVSVTLVENNVLGASSERSIEVREQTPVTVYISLSSDSIYTGQDVTISGSLIYNGSGVPEAWVSLSSKTYFEGALWNDIAMVKTDDFGIYSIVWKPPRPGAYQVKATWAGNSTYPETSISVNFNVFPFGDLITDFSSNSTITMLNFNSSTRVLSFSAEGPRGTVGYVKITLEKDPTFNPQGISVLLDGKPIEYTIDSTNQSWILGITYTHSIHDVIVYFSTDRITEVPDATPPTFLTTWIVSAIAIMVVAIATATVYLIRKRKK
jgi:hypothetical protein